MNKENLIIPALFNDTASKFPERVALQIRKDALWHKVTYKELKVDSLKVANFLLKEGFKKNDFAGIILENRPEWAIIYLGIMQAGLTAVPFDVQLKPQELKNLLFDSDTKILFCSYAIFAEKISPEIQNKLTKLVILDAPDLKLQNSVNFSQIQSITPDTGILPPVFPEDIASLIYTSGTTAKPKGVLLTHKNFCSNFHSIERVNICFPSDNMLSILPLHHTYAFMVTLLLPLFLGAKATYCFSFKPQDLSQIMKEAKVTILVGVPQLFSMLHKAIFEKLKKIPPFLLPLLLPLVRNKVRGQLGRSLRLFASGGARLEPKVGRDLYKLLGIKICEGYGLTETSPVVTFNPPEKIKFGSVGKPIPDVQVKINHPDDAGVGEVLIKGPNVMRGYFQQPELTAQVIKDGWFYSGDLGYLDKEEYLFLTGREKDVIVLSSGKNIYPDELEEYYGKSPYIKEMCIFARYEEKFGRKQESLYAVVVPNLEYFRQKNETDIRGKIRWELENLAKHLTSYSHIMGFAVIKEELPRTALKKLKRYEVRQKYFEEKLEKPEIKEPVFSEEDLKTLNQALAKKTINYIAQETKKPVYLDSHLEIDLGIDSLSRVELGLGLEALFALKIPDPLLYSVSTVREAIAVISELTGRQKERIYETKQPQKSWPQILKAPLKPQILDKIRIEPGFSGILFTFIFKNIFLLFFKIFWLLKIKGRENLPEQGPYIICSNHASYLDGFVIACSLPFRNARDVFFLGHAAIFEHPLVSWAIKIGRLISIDPNIHLTEAMQAVSFVLAQKKTVCIFPEGRRSIDENIGEFKKGIGILLKELDVPVIPVYIKGSHRAWPRGSRFPKFYPLKVTFGKALFLKDFASQDYDALTQSLRDEVIKLTC